MPHASVKTIRDLIYWEYAKLMAGSAVGDRKNYGFVMHAYKKLKDGSLHPSNILNENKKLFEEEKRCAYCNTTETNLEWEHIIPRAKMVIDTMDNMVLACKTCNCSKGGRDPFEWYGHERRYEIPRIVLGKYLKLVFDIHERNGTLDIGDLNKQSELDIYDLGHF